jgi:hypothetical protein
MILRAGVGSAIVSPVTPSFGCPDGGKLADGGNF